jgi:2-haloacid dehalogenase
MPRRVIVFDVNETLLNVRHIEPVFQHAFGDSGALKEWFSLLLLHSEVATLAGPYFDFATLADAALEMTAATRRVALSAKDKEHVLQGMLSLPPHPEVREALQKLRDAGLRLMTLTNSSQRAVDEQMRNAGLSGFFERNFSVDMIRRYKPAPEPYRMVASELNLEPADLRLVAAHAWDIVGAMQAGCAAAFVSRPGKVLFPLTPSPDIVGPDLIAVAQQILDLEQPRV